MPTTHEEALDLKPGSRGRAGRKDRDGQSSVIKLESLSIKVDHLLDLYKQYTDSDAVKSIAEQAGLNAATVRKYIKARAGDDFDSTREKVLQLALVFEELA
jgi:hypothetical protein